MHNQLSQHLQVSERTLEKLVAAGKFPPPLRIGKRVVWASDVVEKWLGCALTKQREWVPASSRRRNVI
ncbi:helix-turn-helix domain-containing protein [Tepidimonas thermarum]|uniref:helix-turn-helix domain-containing protein n=1 Tax=Tepidimonas thermarum TaxID=335431 RepID=UPI00118128DD